MLANTMARAMSGDEGYEKNTCANEAFERDEIAAYKSSLALSRAAGVDQAGPLLETSLKERTAEWAESNVEKIVTNVAMRCGGPNLGRIAPREREVTHGSVGWGERTRNPMPRARKMMGFAALYPSCETERHARGIFITSRASEARPGIQTRINARCWSRDPSTTRVYGDGSRRSPER
jgi:hypothetical protein